MKSRQHAQEWEAPEVDWAVTVERAATEDVRELLRAETRRRRGRWLAGGLVVLAVGAVATLLIRSSLFAPVAGDPVADDTRPVRSVAQLDPARPFASTPAADWANGAGGITLPEARAVGGFSAEQVAETTALVRDALVASRIDTRMLAEHDPAGYLGLLAPDAKRQLEPLFADGHEAEVQSLVSLVAAGAELLPVAPKVTGSMSVRAGDPDELVVHTNYVFAYAFRPQGPTKLVDAMNVIVVVRADVDYVLRHGERWTPSSRGLWYGDASGFGYSIGCDAYRKGFLAPVAAEPSVTAPGGGREPNEFFDPTAPLPAAGGCHA
ncbi:hypothetical protein [Actinophytocola algeriensis]|uniref:Uncharacterized protein n=1 Tax=Actinophytocola algeriensis TaxID=1768010 RepID=A0A7W7Q0A7_9PSEU|nr:hypothetical protein [Actinophytocola algeriensis]MBB4904614.1 hypothetical protein [Actinophytocola algeriensis]MBE1476527.1 hypothetical protein [Actinophytocola algeriensis]